MDGRATYKDQETFARRTVKLYCSFLPAGAGAPTGFQGAGVKGITRTGVGLYTLTLTDRYAKFLALHSDVQLTTPAGVIWQLTGAPDPDGSLFSTPTGTVGLACLIEGAAVFALGDVAADAGNIVYLELTMQNTAVQP